MFPPQSSAFTSGRASHRTESILELIPQGCTTQGGVPSYGPKGDVSSYIFQVNCIKGNGTKNKQDITPDVSYK